MLEEIYSAKQEEIEKIIKNAIKSVEKNIYKIEYNTNKEIIDKIEENYNIKMGAIIKDIYIKGLKDGAKFMKEIIQ